MVSTRKYIRVDFGVGQQVADLAGQELDRREVAEGEVDAAVVVVDRLGDVDHLDPPFDSAGRYSWNRWNLLAVLSVSSPPMETRASTPSESRAPMDATEHGRPLGVLQVAGLDTSLPGLVREVPIRMPRVFRDRFSLDWSSTM